MRTQTRIHTISIHGGFLSDIKGYAKDYFLKQGKLVTYYSDWDYGKQTITDKDEWLEFKKDRTVEELNTLYPKYENLKLIVQDQELLELTLNKVDYTIEDSKEITVDVESGIDLAEDYLHKSMEVMQKYQSQLERFTEYTYNNKVGCHMSSGNNLSEYNQTILLEDSCTDNLQSYLADGWRILAVCPQPDQRRPDYILARYEAHPTRSAERG